MRSEQSSCDWGAAGRRVAARLQVRQRAAEPEAGLARRSEACARVVGKCTRYAYNIQTQNGQALVAAALSGGGRRGGGGRAARAAAAAPRRGGGARGRGRAPGQRAALRGRRARGRRALAARRARVAGPPAPAAGHRAVRAAVVRRAPCTLICSACMPMSICLPDAGAPRSRQCCCRACCPGVLPSLGD